MFSANSLHLTVLKFNRKCSLALEKQNGVWREFFGAFRWRKFIITQGDAMPAAGMASTYHLMDYVIFIFSNNHLYLHFITKKVKIC